MTRGSGSSSWLVVVNGPPRCRDVSFFTNVGRFKHFSFSRVSLGVLLQSANCAHCNVSLAVTYEHVRVSSKRYQMVAELNSGNFSTTSFSHFFFFFIMDVTLDEKRKRLDALLDAIYERRTESVPDAFAAADALGTLSQCFIVTNPEIPDILRRLNRVHTVLLNRMECCFKTAKTLESDYAAVMIMRNGTELLRRWIGTDSQINNSGMIKYLYHSGMLFDCLIPETTTFVNSHESVAKSMFMILRHYIKGKCEDLFFPENKKDVEVLGSAYSHACCRLSDCAILQREFLLDVGNFHRSYPDSIMNLEQGLATHIDRLWELLLSRLCEYESLPLRDAIEDYCDAAKRITRTQLAFLQVKAISYVWHVIDKALEFKQSESHPEPTIEDLPFCDLRRLRRLPRMSTGGKAPFSTR